MKERLSVVSGCPQCGAPIYGKKTIAADEQPVSKKSCVCLGFYWFQTLPPPMQIVPYTSPLLSWRPVTWTVTSGHTTGGDILPLTTAG